MCAATAAITTAGPQPAWPAGPMPMCCPISAGRRAGRAAPTHYRGGDGPLTTQPLAFADPLVEAYAAAGAAAGHPSTDDYNGAQQEGFGRWQMTIRNGRRCSAAGRLSAAGAGAAQSDGRDRRAGDADRARRATAPSASNICSGGEAVVARAEREVILAGGVINSPQLLMLSGIGDPEELAAHGIAPAVPLRGVGKNLQDHISAGHHLRSASEPRAVPRAACGSTGSRVELAKAYLLRHRHRQRACRAASWRFSKRPHAGDAARRAAVVQRRRRSTAEPYLPPFRQAYADGFACRVVVLRPESRGAVELASADPRAPPRIRQNFLATERGLARSCATACAWCARSARQAPLDAVRRRARSRRARRQSDAEIDAHIRATGDHGASPARHLPHGRATTTGGGRRASCACAASRGCAWSMPR